MTSQLSGIQGSGQSNLLRPSEQVENSRKKLSDQEVEVQASEDQAPVQGEELLEQLKPISQDGLYSIRFENSDQADEIIIKIIDRETDEVIRQVPAEEVLDLKQSLTELRGNIIDTVE